MSRKTASSHVYRRGSRLYFWFKDEYGDEVQRRTPYRVGEEDKAAAYAAKFQRLVDELPRQEVSSLYLVRLSSLRVKVGQTYMNPTRRLKAFRTVIPEAELVAVWPGSEDDEVAALSALPNRVANSEVFECSVERATELLDGLLGPHSTPGRKHRRTSLKALKDLLTAPVLSQVPVDS